MYAFLKTTLQKRPREYKINIMASIKSVIPEFEAASQKYAASFDKGSLPMPPGR